MVTTTMSGVQGVPLGWATAEWDKEDWEMQHKAVQMRIAQHKEANATLSVNSMVRLPKLFEQIIATYPEEDPELAFGPLPDLLEKVALRYILIDEYNMEWKRYLERHSA